MPKASPHRVHPENKAKLMRGSIVFFRAVSDALEKLAADIETRAGEVAKN